MKKLFNSTDSGQLMTQLCILSTQPWDLLSLLTSMKTSRCLSMNLQTVRKNLKFNNTLTIITVQVYNILPSELKTLLQQLKTWEAEESSSSIFQTLTMIALERTYPICRSKLQKILIDSRKTKFFSTTTKRVISFKSLPCLSKTDLPFSTKSSKEETMRGSELVTSKVYSSPLRRPKEREEIFDCNIHLYNLFLIKMVN